MSKKQDRTKVASAPRSVVIPTCSLRDPSENGDILDRNRRALCYRQQIVPIHQLILDNLAILTNATCINYYPPLCICFWIKQVVTFLAKVERRLLRHMAELKKDKLKLTKEADKESLKAGWSFREIPKLSSHGNIWVLTRNFPQFWQLPKRCAADTKLLTPEDPLKDPGDAQIRKYYPDGFWWVYPDFPEGKFFPDHDDHTRNELENVGKRSNSHQRCACKGFHRLQLEI